MSDEELLQIIDFYAKREYSLQKMNEMIAAGEADFPKEAKPTVPDEVTDFSVLDSSVGFQPEQALTIAYTGVCPCRLWRPGQTAFFWPGETPYTVWKSEAAIRSCSMTVLMKTR